MHVYIDIYRTGNYMHMYIDIYRTGNYMHMYIDIYRTGNYIQGMYIDIYRTGNYIHTYICTAPVTTQLHTCRIRLGSVGRSVAVEPEIDGWPVARDTHPLRRPV